ncbi:ABC transporter substrate-binding protein [Ktedonobacteria bacterium brp13]|nr:ABC transporter substrate-binding protein [Ktedonobacteria bacterium brp13]
MKRFRSILAITAIAVVVGGLFSLNSSSVARADASASCIQYGAFGKSVAYIEAVKQGYFTDEGLSVCYNQVAGSQQQFNSLLSGQYNIVASTADNFANRYVNTSPDVEIVGASDKGASLDLIVNSANGINSIADLKGKSIAVDAPNSGFVFATEKILAENGLQPSDYSLQVIGGSLQRFQAISAGHTSTGAPVYATILAAPFVEEAHAVSTLKDVASFSTYVAHYQGTSIGVTDAYAQANPTIVTKFLTAMIRGSLYANNPQNQNVVIADIASTDNISTAVATNVYNDTENNHTSGENMAEMVSIPGLMNTIELRQSFNGFNTTVDPATLAVPSPNNLYNDQYWTQAFQNALQQQGQ